MGVLAGQHLVVLDTETTGFDPGRGAQLVEVAAVDVRDAAIGEGWSTLVNPGHAIPADATRVHGITDAMVAGAPSPAAAARALFERCEGLPLVFHNAEFDLPFLLAARRAAGLPPMLNVVLDVLGLARGVFGVGGNRLDQLAARLGVEVSDQHRALGDALTTARAFLALTAFYERERAVTSLVHLAAIGRDVMMASRRPAQRPPAPPAPSTIPTSG